VDEIETSTGGTPEKKEVKVADARRGRGAAGGCIKERKLYPVDIPKMRKEAARLWRPVARNSG